MARSEGKVSPNGWTIRNNGRGGKKIYFQCMIFFLQDFIFGM